MSGKHTLAILKPDAIASGKAGLIVAQRKIWPILD